MEIAEQIRKNRKWLIWGGIALGIFILFMLFSRGSASASSGEGSSGPSEALQAKQMEVQAQLNLASMQFAAQEAAGMREVAMLAAQLNNQLEVADLQSARQLEAMMIQSEENRYLADRQFAATMAQITSQEHIAIAQMEAQAARDEIAAQVAIENTRLMAEMNVAALNAQANQTMAMLQAQVDMEAIRASAGVQQAAISADAQKHGSTMGMIGNIVGGLFGLFSEARLKKNIRYEGETSAGVSRYSYEYLGSSQRHYGVLAEEAERVSPGAVYRDGGYLKVDYGSLLDNLNANAHNLPVPL